MNLELVGALNELERERGISKEILLDAIEAAIVSAYKRNDQAANNVRVSVSDKSGVIQVFAQKEVVDEVMDSANEISLAAAKRIDPNYSVGDIVEVDVTPKDFGRIAAQTAKQVVIQRIREAERALIYEEYSNREGDVVTGIVQRSDYRNVLVDLGKVEAILPPSEQMQRESYAHGTRVKVYISEVRQTTKGPQVIVSRTHPGLLKRLFELEVPEIHDGIVEIKAVAREAGNRSKIAVISRDSNVDPVGACVGPRGMRVQSIVQELKGEKIDIVEYSIDPERFIGSALSPARVMRVFVNEEEKSARAVVPDHQLSLAIGREGQNARLAARLTGWKIDIKSESQMAELALLEAARAQEERKAAAAAAEAAKAADAESELEQDEVSVDVATVGTQESPVDEPSPVSADLADEQEVPAALDAEEALVEDDVEEELLHEIDEEGDVSADESEPVDVEPELDLEIELPETLLDDLEEERVKAPDVQPKVKRSRAAKKAELQDLIEEDVFDEEDDLPSLFDDDDDELEEEDSDEPVVYVVDGSDDREEEYSDDDWEIEKTTDPIRGKDKLVLKDLADLRALLDANERKKK